MEGDNGYIWNLENSPFNCVLFLFFTVKTPADLAGFVGQQLDVNGL